MLMAIINCKKKVKREEKVTPFSSGISSSEASTTESSEFHQLFSPLPFFQSGKRQGWYYFFYTYG